MPFLPMQKVICAHFYNIAITLQNSSMLFSSLPNIANVWYNFHGKKVII